MYQITSKNNNTNPGNNMLTNNNPHSSPTCQPTAAEEGVSCSSKMSFIVSRIVPKQRKMSKKMDLMAEKD